MIYDGMPYDPIQGQGYGGLECVKMTDLKGYLLHQYAYDQKANLNYDTPRQCLNFNQTDF